MAATIGEVVQWLESFGDSEMYVYIDEGGLTLQVGGNGGGYFELGGEPDEDPEA